MQIPQPSRSYSVSEDIYISILKQNYRIIYRYNTKIVWAGQYIGFLLTPRENNKKWDLSVK